MIDSDLVLCKDIEHSNQTLVGTSIINAGRDNIATYSLQHFGSDYTVTYTDN